MMKFALAYREAIDLITADKTLKLQWYELDNDNWVIIEDLVSVLKVRCTPLIYSKILILYYIVKTYKKATLFFSKDTASITAIIPAMDKLDNHLNPHSKKPYYPAIQAAMKLVRKKINHYYSMTDISLTYRIAMVLHPGLKLEYFDQQGWEDEWVNNAENLVQEEYIIHYEGKASLIAPVPETTTSVSGLSCLMLN